MATPSGFICPITHDIMTDPVMCTDGHSYERSAILRWLQSHNTSPMTNCVINPGFTPNISLRNSIQEFLDSQTQVTQSQTHTVCNIEVSSNNDM